MKEATTGPRSVSPKLIATFVFIAAGLVIAVIKPFDGMDSTGNIMLGTVVAALATWIFRPAGGTFIVGAAVVLLGGSFAGLPMTDLAVGFASAPLWLMIPAMFMGAALLKTGLARRIVYAFFKRLNLNYGKILAGWFVVNILFALINPSSTARFLLITPIAVSVADACQLEKGSRERSLIIISAWALSLFPAIAWKNGSLFGPVFSEFLPTGPMRDMATDEMWFRVMAPWLLFGVVFTIALYFMLKPKQKLGVTRAQIAKMYDDLGPMSREEKGCLIAFVLMMVCLVLQTFLPLTTHMALLAALVILLLLGVISPKEVSSGISWDTVVFFGMILSFTRIFEVSGITAWLSPMLSSLMAPIAFSPLVFVLALYGICVIIRFFDVTQGWVSAAILALATPMLFSDFGINPLIPIMVFVCASQLFFFRYHQPWILQAESVCGDSGWNPRHLTKSSILYAVLVVAFLVFCHYYWQLVGVM